MTGCVAALLAALISASAAAGDGGGGQEAGPGDPQLEAPATAEQQREDERRAQRESEAGRQERRDSRTANRDQTDSDALATVERTHAKSVLREPWRPLRPPSGARVSGYLSDFAARIDNGEGKHDTFAVSDLPLRTKAPDGARVPVDLALEDRGNALEPRSPLARLRIAESPAGGVTLDDIGLRVVPVAAAASAKARQVEGQAFAANALGADADWQVTPLPSGFTTMAYLRSEASPERYGLRFELPQGARLERAARAEDGVEIVRGDEHLAQVSAPSAWDADEQPVPVSYSLDGDVLTLDIEHRSADVKYPIALDPTVTVDQRYWYYNGSLEAYGWQSGATSGTFDHTFGDLGLGRGLYTYTSQSRYYNGGDNDYWRWWLRGTCCAAPKYFVYRAEFSLLKTLSESTYLNYGISSWNAVWEAVVATPVNPALNYESREVCVAAGCPTSAGSDGNHPVLITAMSGAGTRCCFKTFMGGAAMYLNDRVPPTLWLTSTPAQPTGWIDSNAYGIELHGADSGGLGVKDFRLDVPGQATKYRSVSCTGNYQSLCPWSSDSGEAQGDAFSYNTADLPEGYNTLSAQTADIAGNWSTPETWTVKVDHTPPEIELSGSLKDHDDETLDPGVYRLTVNATDEASGTPRSGVKSIAIDVDGQSQDSSSDQSCATDSCPLSREWRFATAAFPAGEHTISVRATDQLGHVATQSFRVTTTDPAVCQPVHLDLAATPGAVSLDTCSATSSSWSSQSADLATDFGGISCPTITSCFAVGESGTIQATTNGGSTWSIQASGTSSWLSDVSCPTTSTCFAISGPNILATTNGGSTWTSQSSGTTASLAGISCPSATTCFAVGPSGTILATTNGGSTWTSQSSGTPKNLYGISCPSTSNCFAVGSSGEFANATILATTNGGSTWTSQSSGTPKNLYGVSCPSTSNCFAVGYDGTIRATTNAGSTWSGQSSGTTDSLTAVSCPITSSCYAVGDWGTIRATTNSGASWSGQSSGAGRHLNAVSCPSAWTCFAVGDMSSFRATTNGGSTWTDQPPASPNWLAGVSCLSVSGSTCWAVGSSGTIRQTTNGGSTWTKASYGTANSLNAVSCPSALCFAVGVSGTIRTFGSSWATQSSGTSADLAGISCVSATTCFAVGSSGTILTTTNGGSAWTSQSSGTTANLAGISCVTTTTCFAVGSSGTILATANGGSTWTSQSSGTSADLAGSSCVSATTCFAVGSSGRILATTNAGSTWTSESSGTSNALTGVSCATALTCFAVGSSGTILATTDGGSTWTSESSDTPYNLRGVSCATQCVAAGDQMTVTRRNQLTLPALSSFPDPNPLL